MEIPSYLIKTKEEIYQEFKTLNKFDKLNYFNHQQQQQQEEFNKYNKYNRYSDIKPYNNTIIKLNNNKINEFQYINANRIIPDFENNNNENLYIATQGPLINTIQSFWQCCLEQLFNNNKEIINIIMLTELKEGKIEKCYNYIDNIENDLNEVCLKLSINFEKIKKFNVKNIINENIEERKFEIILNNNNNNDNRNKNKKIIRHFWIRKWQDFSIPNKEVDNNLNLIKYLNKIDSNIKDEFKCKLVHCSAGVGRSGTFIELDWYYNYIFLKKIQGKEFNNKIDIFKSVLNMRKCRVMMVQRFEQYEYLYKIIKELYE